MKIFTNNSFLLQARVLRCDPRSIELFVKIHMQNKDH